jgi:hypothetical protein
MLQRVFHLKIRYPVQNAIQDVAGYPLVPLDEVVQSRRHFCLQILRRQIGVVSDGLPHVADHLDRESPVNGRERKLEHRVQSQEHASADTQRPKRLSQVLCEHGNNRLKESF